MTAEIVVMNRHGIALAADSAVTADLPRGQKIYNTVNKLFALSKRAPIGVMIYNQADITGVPWETVVKEFRRDLGDRKLPTVQAYADAFFQFMESSSSLFPREQQKNDLVFHAISLFRMVLDEIKVDWQATIDSQGDIRGGQVRRVVTDKIRENVGAVLALDLLDGFSPSFGKELEAEFRSELNDCVDFVFESVPLGQVGRRRLRSMASEFMARDFFGDASTGIVFAGFGEDEHYPAMNWYQVQAVIRGKIKKKIEDSATVTAEMRAGIYPFAQSEMVCLFMEGVDRSFRRMITGAIEGFLQGLPDVILKTLAIPDSEKKSLASRMNAASSQIVHGFNHQLDEYSELNHVSPIIDAVAVLPKEELAEMAESLVNLTSFKRRVTADPETVGGPIDVAVISKGDGFIWIKRKHYFDPKLNHHFFSNYF